MAARERASSVPAAAAAAGERAAASEAKEEGGTEQGTLPYIQRSPVRVAGAHEDSEHGSSTRLPKCHTPGEVAVVATAVPAGSMSEVAATVNAAVARERAAGSKAAVAARGHPGSCSRCSPSGGW